MGEPENRKRDSNNLNGLKKKKTKKINRTLEICMRLTKDPTFISSESQKKKRKRGD